MTYVFHWDYFPTIVDEHESTATFLSFDYSCTGAGVEYVPLKNPIVVFVFSPYILTNGFIFNVNESDIQRKQRQG